MEFFFFFENLISPIFPEQILRITSSVNYILFWFSGQYLLGCDVSRKNILGFLWNFPKSLSWRVLIEKGIWWLQGYLSKGKIKTFKVV